MMFQETLLYIWHTKNVLNYLISNTENVSHYHKTVYSYSLDIYGYLKMLKITLLQAKMNRMAAKAGMRAKSL
jgi:hypothetical protein